MRGRAVLLLIFLVLLLSTGVSAASAVYNNSIILTEGPTTGGTPGGTWGLRIETNESLNITAIGLDSLCTTTFVAVIENSTSSQNGTALFSESFGADRVAYPNLVLPAGAYVIGANGTSNRCEGNVSAGLLPLALPYLNITAGVGQNSPQSRIYDISRINYSTVVASAAPTVTLFNVTAIDGVNGSTLQRFNTTISNSSFSITVESNASNSAFINITGLYNITVQSPFYNGGYYTVTTLGHNTTSSPTLQVQLLRFFAISRVDIPNNISFNGSIYIRTLNYTVNYTCLTGTGAQLQFLLNNGSYSFTALSCGNATSQLLTAQYSPTFEGPFNISFTLNSSYLPEFNNRTTSNVSLVADIYNPTITFLNISTITGFINGTTTISMRCNDSLFPQLEYRMTFNSNLIFLLNLTNNTLQANQTQAIGGVNTLIGVCRDLFGNDTETQNDIIYFRTLALIDERNNTPFIVSTVASARVYFDDNSSFYDFKATNQSTVNFTTMGNIKLRFELGYSSGAIVTRYTDVSLSNGTLRVCANPEGVTHYEQLIVASESRPVTMKNIFSQCVVAEDYTRFAYQDSFSLRLFTISMPYYLYTYTDGLQNLLASIDGGLQQSYINLDTLEFTQTDFNINILGSALTYQRIGNDSMRFFYHNLRDNNEDMNLVISRADNGTVLFTTTSFSDPNGWTLTFNFSAIPNLNATTQLKITLTANEAEGTTSTFVRYFNIFGSVGSIRSATAWTIAFFLAIFGLSFTASSLTFSWFGIFILLACEIILSAAVETWYIRLLQATLAVILIYIGIAIAQKNWPQVIN